MRYLTTMCAVVLLLVLFVGCDDASRHGGRDYTDYYGDDAGGDDYVGTGIYTDYTNGLAWQMRSSEHLYSFEEAELFCTNLDLGGHNDWHLPMLVEWLTLVNCYSHEACCMRETDDPTSCRGGWRQENCPGCGVRAPGYVPEAFLGPYGQYWTSLRYNGFNIYVIDTARASIGGAFPRWKYFVRCVRVLDN